MEVSQVCRGFCLTLFSVFFLPVSTADYLGFLKRSLPVLAGIIIFFLPLAFVDLQGLPGMGNEISLSLFLFYLLWNSYQLYMVKKWFTRRKGQGLKDSIQSFCTHYAISRREEEIIIFIIRGMTNKEISYKMGISEKTVKNHIYSIFQKTGIQSRMLLLIRIQSFR